MPLNVTHGYRLITFLSFFLILSEMVKCKECDGNLTFSEFNVLCTSKAVANLLFSEVSAEEKELTRNAENVAKSTGLTVSGDGTWRKRGISPLQRVTTLISHYTGNYSISL